MASMLSASLIEGEGEGGWGRFPGGGRGQSSPEAETFLTIFILKSSHKLRI